MVLDVLSDSYQDWVFAQPSTQCEEDKMESVNSLDQLERDDVEEGGGIFCLSAQPGETNGQYPGLRRENV